MILAFSVDNDSVASNSMTHRIIEALQFSQIWALSLMQLSTEQHVCLKNHAYVQQYLCMSGKLAVHQWSDMCIDLIVAARSLSIPERYMYHRRSAERDHGRKTSYAQLNFFDASDIVAYL